MKTVNEEMDGNEPTTAPPEENVAPVEVEEEAPIDADSDEAGRPAGESGLFGDPRPNDDRADEEDTEPEL